MKKARFTIELIIAVLKERAAGALPTELIRRHTTIAVTESGTCRF